MGAAGAVAPSVELTEYDRQIVAGVEESLARGIELKRWWERAEKAGSYRDQFPLQRAFNPARRSIGFFDEAGLSFGTIPVTGVVQEMLFDYTKTTPEATRDQVREFVMRHFLRVSDHRKPAAFALKDLKRTKDQEAELSGWGYSQCYYKLRESGRVGRFAASEEARIVDLREIGDRHEWIVLKARLFTINVTLSPLGGSAPYMVLPLAAFTEEYLIASREFIVCQEKDLEPGVLGRYGFGYATLRDTTLRSPLLWGPGRFNPGFEMFQFEVRDTGETVVTSPFAVNRPEQIFGVKPDPIAWGARVADLISFGLTSRLLPGLRHGFDPLLTPIEVLNATTGNLPADAFGISKESVERYFLVQHFMAVYEMLTGSLMTYCQVPDWTAPEEELPPWVRSGLVE